MYRLIYQIILRKESLVTCFINNVKSFHSESSLKPMEQKLKVGSLELNYLTVGSGPHSILCLPGALGTIWTDFKPQIEGLDQNAFTVVVWDPPGYGRSRPPDRDFPADFFRRDAECAANLMQGLNLAQYSLLGWSDGGITALILAAKQRNNIKKLVVWGANSYVTQQDAKLYQGIRDTSRWSSKMRDPMVNVYGKDYFEKTWTAWVDAMVHIADTGGNICKDDLQFITAQTLVIHGAKDPLVPALHADYLISNIRGSKLHVFEEGKHNLHIRFAPEFNQLVNSFLLQRNSSL